MRVVLILLFSLGLTWCGCSNVSAMLTIETDGVLLHFPEGEAAIAARLNHNLADIMIYLQKMGLPVKRPLHIVVDENQDEPDVQVHVIPHLEIRIPDRCGLAPCHRRVRDPGCAGMCTTMGLKPVSSNRHRFLGHHHRRHPFINCAEWCKRMGIVKQSHVCRNAAVQKGCKGVLCRPGRNHRI